VIAYSLAQAWHILTFCQLELHLADTNGDKFSSRFELHGKLALNGNHFV
jgi:hypothetical protein